MGRHTSPGHQGAVEMGFQCEKDLRATGVASWGAGDSVQWCVGEELTLC